MNRPPRSNASTATPPSPELRMPAIYVASPHPATWPLERLEAACQKRTQTRGGPGGQHRNRTASGVFATLELAAAPGSRAISPGEVVALTGEATEQRSQHRNREVAFRRLRFVLAWSVRTGSPLDRGDPNDTPHPSAVEPHDVPDDEEERIRRAYEGTALKLADSNPDKPAVLALLLNDWLAAGGQPSLVGAFWKVSTSRVVAAVRSVPTAWTWANRVRAHHDRPPLHR